MRRILTKETMTIWSISNRTSGNTSKSNLIEEKEFSIRFEPAVEKVRRVGKPGSASICRVSLTEQSLHDIHDSAQKVSSATQCCWSYRAEDGSSGNDYVNEIMETVVDDAVWIVDCEKVISNEHFEP